MPSHRLRWRRRNGSRSRGSRFVFVFRSCSRSLCCHVHSLVSFSFISSVSLPFRCCIWRGASLNLRVVEREEEEERQQKKKIKWEEAKKKIVFCFPRALPNANERAKFEKKQQKNDSIQEADTIIDIDLDLDFLSTVPLSLSISLSRTGFRRYSICFLRCTGLVFLILFFLFFKRCFTAFWLPITVFSFVSFLLLSFKCNVIGISMGFFFVGTRLDWILLGCTELSGFHPRFTGFSPSPYSP